MLSRLRKKTQLSAPPLEKLLEKWQRILRKQDYSVTAEYCQPWDFSVNDGRVAEAGVNIARHLAKIRILEPSMIDPKATPSTRDVEMTLVHELLHIWFEPFRPDLNDDPAVKLRYDMWEQCIDTLSEIIVGLDRD